MRAGSLGINLTRAKYVIFAELDWSPAIHRQAEDRLHRIGQKNTVFAYYLIGKRTLDEHVANILVDKSYEIDAIMDEVHDSYENKEKAKLIIAGLRAGNLGINLTRAKYVIFAELDWSPAIHRQAEDRLHRICLLYTSPSPRD